MLCSSFSVKMSVILLFLHSLWKVTKKYTNNRVAEASRALLSALMLLFPTFLAWDLLKQNNVCLSLVAFVHQFFTVKPCFMWIIIRGKMYLVNHKKYKQRLEESQKNLIWFNRVMFFSVFLSFESSSKNESELTPPKQRYRDFFISHTLLPTPTLPTMQLDSRQFL